MDKKDLFIIEAPGKIKTLRGLLHARGMDALVQATGGHLYDMPESLDKLGIDANFQDVKRKLKNEKAVFFMRKAAREARNIYIATDADTEGDVIAWDAHELLKDLCPDIMRVRLKGMDQESLAQALEEARPVSKIDAIPGRVRAMVDRLIGHSFSKDGVGVGRVSSGLLGLLHHAGDNISATRVRLSAPAKDGHGPWVAQFDTNKIVPEDVARKLTELSFPALEMKQQAPAPNQAMNMGDIMVSSGDELGMTPKETEKSLQNMYEGGMMSYPRAGSRGVSKAAQKRLQRMLKRSGYRGNAERIKEKSADDVHDAPYPIGDVDVSKDPRKLGDDYGVQNLVARKFVKTSLDRTMQKAGAKQIYTFLINQGFSKDVSEFVAKLPWTREIGPRAPGEKTFVDSQVTYRAPEIALLEKAVKLNLGRPSTWANHIDTFMKRELCDDDLKLTEKGKRWVAGTPKELLDPRLSGAIEAACDRILPEMMDTVDREPWSILAEKIVSSLPESLKEVMQSKLEAAVPDYEASYSDDIVVADPSSGPLSAEHDDNDLSHLG